jgi:hypothetical protein
MTINGVEWIHLEGTSPGLDTTIHNDIYMTSFEGRQLTFNFNSTVAQRDKFKDLLLKARDSIRIRQ